MESRMQEVIIDDLKKLEDNINKLISYAQYNNYKEYKKEIEEIENFLSYWKQHSKINTN